VLDGVSFAERIRAHRRSGLRCRDILRVDTDPWRRPRRDPRGNSGFLRLSVWSSILAPGRCDEPRSLPRV